MATLREIKGRIQSVSNTKKITKTMEMISAAKAKRAIDKVHAAQPYARKISDLISSIGSLNTGVFHPLLRKPDQVKRVGILVLTANRGLCGGFNNNVIKLALAKVKEYKQSGIETEVYLVGKKAMSVFKYQKVAFEKSFSHIDDKPVFNDAAELANIFMEKFETGHFDAAEIFFTKYFSSSRQSAFIERVLPLSIKVLDKALGKPSDSNSPKNVVSNSAVFEPDEETIISELLPRAIRMAYFQALLESIAGEQIARRIAMKSATDSATDMIKDMTRLYNRARQAKITQEISEIVAGADSVS
ncbi:MAG: ATP synthase F1 subunit gamma [Spirochaetia bacterium]|nr:ATP synthase F1 subunit gamma [Spirochaetia bacterium]